MTTDAHYGCPACRKYCAVKDGLSACCHVGADPSVTTILSVISKPALIPWAVKMEREAIRAAFLDALTDQAKGFLALEKDPDAAWNVVLRMTESHKAADKVKNKAAEIGSAAHALIEWQTKRELGFPVSSEPPAAPEAAQWAFMAWQDWARKVRFKPLESELVVYSTQHGYIGTVDTIAFVEEQLTCVDYKTGKAVYREAHLQNVAYRQAYAEANSGMWTKGLVLRLPKAESDPEFEPVEVTEGHETLPAFLGFKAGWQWMRK